MIKSRENKNRQMMVEIEEIIGDLQNAITITSVAEVLEAKVSFAFRKLIA